MSKLLASIACNLDADMLLASLPLFDSEKVQAIEWSFDALYKVRNIPPWFVELLRAFAAENRLIGHGVYFSLFSGKWLPEQQQWLDHLKKVGAEFRFDHITEHFGFMTGADFHHGAPIGIPYTASTLAIGRDRLKRIADACQCPVGLENLAFSYSIDEVRKHGQFLAELIEPVNGFIILDVHNLYCQIHNFDLDAEAVFDLYPLERVREIHVSGGSWEDSVILPGKKIRRDTHDDAVPDEVFSLLERALQKCPNMKYVVLEQLGTALKTTESREKFQADFYRMEAQVQRHNERASSNTIAGFMPATPYRPGAPREDPALHAQQLELSNILENAVDVKHAAGLLRASSLAQSAWETERWAPEMLETAVRIAQKWKNGFLALLLICLGIAPVSTQTRADTALIKSHLTAITKTEGFRNHQNPELLDKTAAYLYSYFEQYADTVFYQDYLANGQRYRNVIGAFGTHNRERIVVGAHYDVCDNQEGADDNASGVVGLLELARLLKGRSLNYRIDLVAYTLEEPPYFRTEFMGSYVHAKSLADNNTPVYGMVSLEMIAYFKDGKKTQSYPVGILSLFYGNRGDFITLVNKFGKGKFARKFGKRFKKASIVKTKKFTGPRALPGIDFSDHLNYWDMGFSALMVTDTSFYRNNNYHEATDTMETLDLRRMAGVIDGVFSALTALK